MEDPAAHRRASDTRKYDVICGLIEYEEVMKRTREDEVLNIECGCGDLTNDIVVAYLKHLCSKEIVGTDTSEELLCYEKIIGTDTSEELLSCARNFNSGNSIDYVSLDISRDKPFKNLPSYQMFDRIFCFSCLSWTRDSDKALENIRYLLKKDGECFFSFVGSSPVYDTYKTLAENPRWAKYMKDHKLIIPFTHFFDIPGHAFSVRMRAAGIKVLRSKTTEIITVDLPLESLKEHVSEVNHFIDRIPLQERSDFVDDCLKVLSDLRVTHFMTYKVVTAYGRNPSELPRSETLHAEEELATNDTDEEFCFIESSDVQETSNYNEGQICEQISEQTSFTNQTVWCTVS